MVIITSVIGNTRSKPLCSPSARGWLYLFREMLMLSKMRWKSLVAIKVVGLTDLRLTWVKKKSSTSKKQKNEKKSGKTSQADIDLTLGAFELLQQIGSPKHIDAVLLFH